ncbi:MAG: type II secretion system GspH family protein [Oscillospiraceae bacterium]|nr:type II secretion system GspH family protein [Oscillospiraceae bacterium]
MRNKKGFTIIELVVVIAIISIMSAVAVPNIIASNRRAEAAKQNHQARAFYLAVHQTISNTKQNDNTETEFSIFGSYRISGAAPIVSTPDPFFLYVNMGDNATVISAELRRTTTADYIGTNTAGHTANYPPVITAPATTPSFSDNVFAELIAEIEGYSSSIGEAGHYYMMFDSDFRVLMAYFSKFGTPAAVAGYAFTNDNRIGSGSGVTFGAYPTAYGLIGTFRDDSGASHDRTSPGIWFGGDAIGIINGI